jgi:hypothetical protein
MGGAKKTRKFGAVKRMLAPTDMRLYVPLLRPRPRL